MGIPQNALEVLLSLAGKDRDAQIQSLLDLRRHLGQHRETAADVEAADTHREPGGSQGSCEVNGPWKLVGLNTDQRHQPLAPSRPDLPDDPLRSDPAIGLVERGGDDVNLVSEHPTVLAVEGKAVENRQRVRRDVRAEPLDHVSVVIVMGRFDQVEAKHLSPGVPGAHSAGLVSGGSGAFENHRWRLRGKVAEKGPGKGQALPSARNLVSGARRAVKNIWGCCQNRSR